MSCNNCTSGSSCSSGSCSFENNNASGTCTSSTPHYGKCCGGSCSSVREMVLSPLELSLLQLFSVYPFLPAARDKDGFSRRFLWCICYFCGRYLRRSVRAGSQADHLRRWEYPDCRLWLQYLPWLSPPWKYGSDCFRSGYPGFPHLSEFLIRSPGIITIL